MKDLILFHGTDERIIKMSKAERLSYLEKCNHVIDTVFPLFEPYLKYEILEICRSGEMIQTNELGFAKYEHLLSEKGGPNLYSNLLEKLIMINARNHNSRLYQYNDLYLTFSKRKAMNYACRSFAGGELGLCAYRLIQGYEILFTEKLFQEDEFQNALTDIKEFAIEANSRPAIVTIDNVDVSCLERENGGGIEQNILEFYVSNFKGGASVRYKKDIEFQSYKVELVDEELANEITAEYGY